MDKHLFVYFKTILCFIATKANVIAANNNKSIIPTIFATVK